MEEVGKILGSEGGVYFLIILIIYASFKLVLDVIKLLATSRNKKENEDSEQAFKEILSTNTQAIKDCTSAITTSTQAATAALKIVERLELASKIPINELREVYKVVTAENKDVPGFKLVWGNPITEARIDAISKQAKVQSEAILELLRERRERKNERKT